MFCGPLERVSCVSVSDSSFMANNITLFSTQSIIRKLGIYRRLSPKVNCKGFFKVKIADDLFAKVHNALQSAYFHYLYTSVSI